MYKGAGGGGEEAQYRENNGDEVDGHGEGDAEFDGVGAGMGKAFEVGKFREVVGHEGNVG